MEFEEDLNRIYSKVQELKRLDNYFSLFGAGFLGMRRSPDAKGYSPRDSLFKPINLESFTYDNEQFNYDPNHPLQVWGHRYELNPPVNDKFIFDFEKEYDIKLPLDSREFYLKLGNGGAGPDYGLFSFDLIQEYLPKDQPDHLKTLFKKRTLEGCIYISDMGCAAWELLVISGRERGQIFLDVRADMGRVIPYVIGDNKKISFLEWYEHWLDEYLERINMHIEEHSLIKQEYSWEQILPGQIIVRAKISQDFEAEIKIGYAGCPEFRPSFGIPLKIHNKMGPASRWLESLKNYDSNNPPHFIDILKELEIKIRDQFNSLTEANS